VNLRSVGGFSPFTVSNSWKEIEEDFEDNIDLQRKNLVIIDADKDFQKRKSDVLNTTNGIVADETLFLMPVGNKNGNLETLLERMIPVDKRDVLKCFQTYITCT